MPEKTFTVSSYKLDRFRTSIRSAMESMIRASEHTDSIKCDSLIKEAINRLEGIVGYEMDELTKS